MSCQDPRVISNKPGLAEISFRADEFTGFRRALLRPRSGEQAIGSWYPAPGDLGLQVLEWWAYLGDVLTFYNERIANESYLRTATRQASVANLVALLGYQPAPGIAATGTVAATRSTMHPGEPLVIPAGMRLSSSATSGVPAQAFEAGAAASFTGPSSVPVTLDRLPDTLNTDSAGRQAVLLAGRVSGVKAGDTLLLVTSAFAGTDDSWSLVTVAGLTPAPDPGTGAPNTLVSFVPGAVWGPPGGAGAPSPDPTAGYRLLRPTATAALWNQVSGQAASTSQVITSDPPQAHLSAVVRAIAPGDLVLFTFGAPLALAVVAKVAEEFWALPYPPPSAPTDGGGFAGVAPTVIPVAHTVLTLTTNDFSTLQGVADPTTVTVRYGWKDVGTIIQPPAATLDSLPRTVTVPASYAPSNAVTAILQDAAGAGVLVTVNPAGQGPNGQNTVALTGAGTPAAQLAAPLQVPLRLLLDLVPVSRGTTVTGETLGSGNAALIGQSFTLAKSPLTYLASGAGSVAALAVYVDGVRWREVPSFYGQPASAQVYVVSRSPDQSVTTITFGDGVDGSRLTSGTGNITATYRYGSGAASPPAGRLTTISQPQPNLAAIQNPIAVVGGVDPQSPADVKASAPASVFTFGRAISADDYEVIAAHAPGVSRAAAYWTFDGARQRTLVTVYVGDDQQAAAAAAAALAGAEDPNRPASVVPATAIPLTLSCTLVIAANRQADAVKAAATAAVADPATGLFSPARMGIGQRLYRSAIDAALMVDGVVAVHDLAVYKILAPRRGIFLRNPPLGELWDPGEGAYYSLAPDQATIEAVTAGG